MAKGLDWFMIIDKVMDIHHYIRQWVGCGGNFDNFPIFLEFRNGPIKPPSSLKFNKTWLKDSSFQTSMSSLWVPFDPNNRISTVFQFTVNINKIKEDVKTQTNSKRR